MAWQSPVKADDHFRMDFDIAVYFGMFFSALVAATLLPSQSEIVLVGLLVAGEQPAWILILVAIAGNVLGSSINWLLGAFFYRFHEKKWFPIKKDKLDKAVRIYSKYGRWSLFCSWVPLIGDPLTLVAGILREPFYSFFIIVLFAKAFRYVVVAGVTLSWMAA